MIGKPQFEHKTQRIPAASDFSWWKSIGTTYIQANALRPWVPDRTILQLSLMGVARRRVGRRTVESDVVSFGLKVLPDRSTAASGGPEQMGLQQ